MKEINPSCNLHLWKYIAVNPINQVNPKISMTYDYIEALTATNKDKIINKVISFVPVCV